MHLASFRSIKKSNSLRELVRYHSENKYLLTAYNQKEITTLGRIVANQERKSVDEVIKDYEIHLFSSFKRLPTVESNINVMMKVMGYFSHQLSKEEKSFFLNSLQKCRDGKLPLNACVSILKSWIIQFQQDYLGNQTFLETYPEELVTLDKTVYGEQKDYWK